MPAKPATVTEYLGTLPEDRREDLEKIRAVILKNLPRGYEEGFQYGMIGYYVPHSVYPPGYHCDPRQPLPFASLSARKGYISLGLMSTYMDPKLDAWFRQAWAKSGKKLDMGKACVRIKKVDDAPLDVIGEAVRRVPAEAYIEKYEANLGGSRKSSAKEPGAKKITAKSAVKKRAATKAAKKNSAKLAKKRGA
ncbi:MAG: DUF1801 domain-containing protein [Phycisphaerae bacterium]|nr:DUF1801 domain-containing protein [Phycisphaerae bacterium]